MYTHVHACCQDIQKNTCACKYPFCRFIFKPSCLHFLRYAKMKAFRGRKPAEGESLVPCFYRYQASCLHSLIASSMQKWREKFVYLSAPSQLLAVWRMDGESLITFLASVSGFLGLLHTCAYISLLSMHALHNC